MFPISSQALYTAKMQNRWAGSCLLRPGHFPLCPFDAALVRNRSGCSWHRRRPVHYWGIPDILRAASVSHLEGQIGSSLGSFRWWASDCVWSASAGRGAEGEAGVCTVVFPHTRVCWDWDSLAKNWPVLCSSRKERVTREILGGHIPWDPLPAMLRPSSSSTIGDQ